MKESWTERDSAKAVFSAMRQILNPKIFLFFVLMFMAVFLIAYFGIYVGLNLTLQSPLTSSYTTNYPSYIVPIALALSLLIFFLFFYILSIELELKKRLELRTASSIKSVLVSSLKKYPKFLVAIIFQLFLAIGGLILLVIPGIYLGTRSMFFDIESHNNDVTLSTALMDSFDITKRKFLKPLIVFLFYSILFFVLVYVLFSISSISLMLLLLGFSIISSFCIITYTFSSDTLYHLLKKPNRGAITSALARRIMGGY
jgi:hypothetical protein